MGGLNPSHAACSVVFVAHIHSKQDCGDETLKLHTLVALISGYSAGSMMILDDSGSHSLKARLICCYPESPHAGGLNSSLVAVSVVFLAHAR